MLGLTAREGVPSNTRRAGDRLSSRDHRRGDRGEAQREPSVRHGLGLDRQVPDQALRPGGTPGTLAEGSSRTARRSAPRAEVGGWQIGDCGGDGRRGWCACHSARGPRVHGKETFRVKIINDSPMILNGLAIGGLRRREGRSSVGAGRAQPAAPEEPDRPGVGRCRAPASPEGGDARRRGRPERALRRVLGPSGCRLLGPPEEPARFAG